ncbi:hypothetical protein [Marilutibacter chinensis]|nr:hypothetical protein [Lysobacter chinensis]
MAFVAGLHLYASWWLLFRFQLQVPMSANVDDEPVLLVRFISRAPTEPEVGTTAAPAAVSPARARIAHTPESPSRPVPGETSAVFLPSGDTPAPQRPLDLSVPGSDEPTGFARPDPLASRATLDPRSTRFADDWATDGDAVEKLKEDSVVARTLLGLFGGRDSCTAKAIRERRRDCVGADHQPGLHEALQGR